MSVWGRVAYGDPCRECGYSWPENLDVTCDAVRHTPVKIRTALGASDGTARAPGLGWDARAYVCHVADNLRIWAERLIAALETPGVRIGRYDADLLAAARGYDTIPLPAALWSLDQAVGGWLSAVDAARLSKVTLVHPDRGLLALSDVTSANAHDAYHHVFDVQRCLAIGAATANPCAPAAVLAFEVGQHRG